MSMQVLAAPRCAGRMLGSAGQRARRAGKGAGAAPPGAAPPHGWDRAGLPGVAPAFAVGGRSPRGPPAGGWGGGPVELVGAPGVGRVVDRARTLPRETPVGGLAESHVELAGGGVPVLVGEIEVAGVGGARREALDDAVAEVRVGEEAVRVLARRGRLH